MKCQVFVGRSTTVLSFLFRAHTLCMNYVTKTFLLVSSLVPSKQQLRCVTDKAKKAHKTKKHLIRFHNHSSLLPVLRITLQRSQSWSHHHHHPRYHLHACLSRDSNIRSHPVLAIGASNFHNKPMQRHFYRSVHFCIFFPRNRPVPVYMSTLQ